MHHRKLLLTALKYPKAGTDFLQDDEEFGTLVIWLENTKVGPVLEVGPSDSAGSACIYSSN